MNKKLLWTCLLAAALLVLAFMPGVGGNVLMAMALPFTLLGDGLRALSLSGSVGNVVAIVLFVLVCCVPLVFWFRTRRQPEDGLLILLVGVLAFVLYMMVNPHLRPELLREDAGDILYAGTVWSVVITWGVLKLLRSSDRILEHNIYKALRIFLLICAAECLLDGFGLGFAGFRESINWVNASNYGLSTVKFPTYLFLFLDFAAGAAEGGLTALVLYKGAKLLSCLEADPYSEESMAAVRDVSKWCKETLVIVSLTNLALNLGQIIMAGVILNVGMEIRFPVMEMAIAFGMLVLTRLLGQGKQLKDDNDLFV